MARGRIIPDQEIIELMDQGMTDREIAKHYNRQYSHIQSKLGQIKAERRAKERKDLNPVTVKHMELDEIKARYGERGENAEVSPVGWYWGVREELR